MFQHGSQLVACIQSLAPPRGWRPCRWEPGAPAPGAERISFASFYLLCNLVPLPPRHGSRKCWGGPQGSVRGLGKAFSSSSEVSLRHSDVSGVPSNFHVWWEAGLGKGHGTISGSDAEEGAGGAGVGAPVSQAGALEGLFWEGCPVTLGASPLPGAGCQDLGLCCGLVLRRAPPLRG